MRRISLGLLLLCSSVVLGQSFPSSISNLAARWEADCITFPSSVCGTPSNGSSVSTWADQSGNGNTFTIAAGTCTFNTSQINSKPAVNFNATCHGTITSINFASGGSTVYTVLKLANTSGGYALLSGVHNGSINQWFAETKEQGLDDTTATNMGGGTANADTNWHQLGFGLSTNCTITGSFYRIDMAADGSPSSNGPSTCDETGIGWNVAGSNQIFSGQVAALIVWQKELNSTERGLVECYLWGKYALGAGTGCNTSSRHRAKGFF